MLYCRYVVVCQLTNVQGYFFKVCAPHYRICSTENVPMGEAGWEGGGSEAGEEGAGGMGIG